MQVNEIIISRVLKDLGISPVLSGYHYARYAINAVIKDPSVAASIVNKLYPLIAKQFNTTPSRVERAMRHAIESGWIKGNQKLQYELFGFTVDANKGKPTNGEFIATVADYLNLGKPEENSNG